MRGGEGKRRGLTCSLRTFSSALFFICFKRSSYSSMMGWMPRCARPLPDTSRYLRCLSLGRVEGRMLTTLLATSRCSRVNSFPMNLGSSLKLFLLS